MNATNATKPSIGRNISLTVIGFAILCTGPWIMGAGEEFIVKPLRAANHWAVVATAATVTFAGLGTMCVGAFLISGVWVNHMFRKDNQ